MKRTKLIVAFLAVVVLTACSGSETYRGLWKATDNNGEQVDIVFGENDFTITKEKDVKKYEYSQNKVNISNGVELYGINLDNGKTLQIHFPIADDESKGAILDMNGRPVYIISRNNYPSYNDVYGL